MTTQEILITDGSDGKYIELIVDAFAKFKPKRVDVAMAYATHRGVDDLSQSLEDIEGWSSARKRWLVGIDYCRSDPLALEHLRSLPRSRVKIFDGTFVSTRTSCVPRTSYHVKLYIVRGETRNAVILGSGNLSHTGLKVGIEAGTSILDVRTKKMRAAEEWFEKHWSNSISWTRVRAAYTKQYSSVQNRKTPAVLEDDTAPTSSGNSGQISPQHLRTMRVCDNLWIDTGNLHENLGKGRPGNQLMLKRNSRAFFGFPVEDLEKDSWIGSVEIEYDGQVRLECQMRFSNNAMDVLTLPIPGTEGPAQYDQETLRFERKGIRKFRLHVGRAGDKSSWRQRSKRIDAAFRMKKGRAATIGREWGVY